MTDHIAQRLKKDLIATYIKRGFEDEDDLYFYVQHVLGFSIPRQKFCPEHCAPWDFIRDMFFERVLFAFAFGSRGSGKTFQLALLNHLDMLYKQCGVEVVHAAAHKDQALRGYSYFKAFFADAILAEMIVTSIQSKTILVNGSELEITAGTMKGLNGSHAQKVRVDEIELLPYSLLDEAMSISMSKLSKTGVPVRAQDCWGSTRKSASGTVTRVLEEAEEKRMSIYCHCIWENLERCTRLCHDDPEWGNCPAWSKCKGKAHETHGWYPVADFIQKTLNLSLSAFSAQWENKSPSGGEKVYGNFWDENVHVLSWVDGGRFKSFYSVFHEKEIPRSWRRIGGMDFGSNFAFGLMAIEPKYGIWILYYEYFYTKERLMKRHADEIAKAPGIELVRRVYGDPSAKQGILDMNALLRSVFRRDVIWPAMNALAEGVDAVKRKLEVDPNTGLPGLYVLDTCTETRREFREWEHGQLPDGKVDLESFEEGNDHCIDFVRYSIFSHARLGRTSYRFASVDGL